MLSIVTHTAPALDIGVTTQHNQGMELKEFMERVGAGPSQVGRAINKHPSTVIRIRDKQWAPGGAILLALQAWGVEAATALRLRKHEWLDFDYLLDDPPAQESEQDQAEA